METKEKKAKYKKLNYNEEKSDILNNGVITQLHSRGNSDNVTQHLRV